MRLIFTDLGLSLRKCEINKERSENPQKTERNKYVKNRTKSQKQEE